MLFSILSHKLKGELLKRLNFAHLVTSKTCRSEVFRNISWMEALQNNVVTALCPFGSKGESLFNLFIYISSKIKLRGLNEG